MTTFVTGVDRCVRRPLVALLDEQLSAALTSAHPDAALIEPAIWEHAIVRIARDILGRPGKQFRSRLVELAFELGGGDAVTLSSVIPQLVELVHAGSLIIDDVQDGSTERRGGPAIHRIHGVPLAINTGTWLYFAAYHLVERAALSASTTLEIYRLLSRMMFRSHQGQALDLAVDVTELRQREVGTLADLAATLKSGELMGFAAQLGGLAAGAAGPQLDALSRFGVMVGVALQHLDDLGGLCNEHRRDKGREDLAGRRLSWVWACLATELDEMRFARLQRTVRNARLDELDAIADEVTVLLGHTARHEIVGRLATARALLRDAFSEHPALLELDAELVGLERALG